MRPHEADIILEMRVRIKRVSGNARQGGHERKGPREPVASGEQVVGTGGREKWLAGPRPADCP